MGDHTLRHPIATYASEALVELRKPAELAVDVRAPSPDLFFNVVRDSIEHRITHRWPGLTYQLPIPCPTRDVDGADCHSSFPLDGLRRFREHDMTAYACIGCGETHKIPELLIGFAAPELTLQPQLERLHDDLVEANKSINELKAYAADTADIMRRVLRVVSTEISDCRRLFTLTSVNMTGLGRMKLYQRRYRPVLWCEHPGSGTRGQPPHIPTMRPRPGCFGSARMPL